MRRKYFWLIVLALPISSNAMMEPDNGKKAQPDACMYSVTASANTVAETPAAHDTRNAQIAVTEAPPAKKKRLGPGVHVRWTSDEKLVTVHEISTPDPHKEQRESQIIETIKTTAEDTGLIDLVTRLFGLFLNDPATLRAIQKHQSTFNQSLRK